jgi:hypothetical protein
MAREVEHPLHQRGQLAGVSGLKSIRKPLQRRVPARAPFPARGSPRSLPRGTATAQLNADARRVADGDRVEQDIDIMDWLGGAKSVRATEQAVGLGGYEMGMDTNQKKENS